MLGFVECLCDGSIGVVFEHVLRLLNVVVAKEVFHQAVVIVATRFFGPGCVRHLFRIDIHALRSRDCNGVRRRLSRVHVDAVFRVSARCSYGCVFAGCSAWWNVGICVCAPSPGFGDDRDWFWRWLSCICVDALVISARGCRNDGCWFCWRLINALVIVLAGSCREMGLRSAGNGRHAFGVLARGRFGRRRRRRWAGVKVTEVRSRGSRDFVSGERVRGGSTCCSTLRAFTPFTAWWGHRAWGSVHVSQIDKGASDFWVQCWWPAHSLHGPGLRRSWRRRSRIKVTKGGSGNV
ncbi:uncharacterized protein J3D65DRAFT_626053 [Phyllosticta citribraziliensis]|uniref:Uncharacterized protein n=1 Tax=Phyllosticta citribraziliensis TaxID=989973 RepID=A0ABR1LQW0_9PEZI